MKSSILFRSSKKRLGIFGVAIVALASVPAWVEAATTAATGTAASAVSAKDATTGVVLANTLNTTIPALFSGSTTNALALASKYQACLQSTGAMGAVNGFSDIFSQISGGGAKKIKAVGGFNPNTCQAMNSKSTAGDDVSEVNSCEQLEVAGVFNPTALKQQEDHIDQTISLLQCKDNLFKKTQSQIDCLTTQANQISSQAASLKNLYMQNIQKFQQDNSNIKSQIDNRNNQIADINTKLTGDKDGTGSTGMLSERDKTTALISSLETNLATLKSQQQSNAQSRQILTEQIANRTMALTTQCFSSTTVASFRCQLPGSPDNKAMSPMDYLVCRYRQNQTRLGDNGQIQDNANLAAVGNQKADELQSLLTTVMSQAPQSTSAQQPADANSFAAQADAPNSVMTVADIEQQYGQQLSSYDGKGIPVHDFVMKYMGSCFQKAQLQVNNERVRANSTIAQREYTIQQAEQQTSLGVRTFINQATQQFADNMTAMTGDQQGLDTSACNNAQPTVQTNCMQDILDNLKAQVSGVAPATNPQISNYPMTINIAGNSATNGIQIQCNGLNGCVTRLQSYSTAVKRDVQSMQNYQKQYAQQAYQQVEQFTQQIQQSLAPQSQALRNQLKSINQTLGTVLGVTQGIHIEEIQGEPLEKDDDGLPKITGSTNMLALLSSGMTPPLINVAANDFSDATSGIAEAVNKLHEKESKAEAAKSKLPVFAQSCRQKELNKAASKLKADTQSYTAAGCPSDYQNCVLAGGDSAQSKALSDTRTILDSIDGNGLDTDSLTEIRGILESGIADCSTTVSDLKQREEIARQHMADYGNCQQTDTMCIMNNQKARDDLAKLEEKEISSSKPSQCTAISQSMSKDAGTAKSAVNRATAGMAEDGDE